MSRVRGPGPAIVFYVAWGRREALMLPVQMRRERLLFQSGVEV